VLSSCPRLQKLMIPHCGFSEAEKASLKEAWERGGIFRYDVWIHRQQD